MAFELAADLGTPSPLAGEGRWWRRIGLNNTELGATMVFDVRLPIGLLFLAIGVLVAGYGLTGDAAASSARTAGVNIDLAWGAVMAAFGAVMLGLVVTARFKRPSTQRPPPPPPSG